jgi:hypothetical protein
MLAPSLGDPGAGHEHRGRPRGHLRPVELLEQLRLEQVCLAVGDQRVGEGDFDLGAGLFGRDDRGQP